MFFASGLVITSRGSNEGRLMVESGVGHESGTMKRLRAENAKLDVPPVKKGAAEGVFFCA